MPDAETPSDEGGVSRSYEDTLGRLELAVYAIKLAAAYHGHASDAWHGHQDDRRALLWAEGQKFIRKIAVAGEDTFWAVTEKGWRLASDVFDHGAASIVFDSVGGWSIAPILRP